jgi:hypothetical protein
MPRSATGGLAFPPWVAYPNTSLPDRSKGNLVNESLEEMISSAGNIVDMLRSLPVGYYKLPYPEEHTNWRDEQAAWKKTVTGEVRGTQ